MGRFGVTWLGSRLQDTPLDQPKGELALEISYRDLAHTRVGSTLFQGCELLLVRQLLVQT